MNKFLQALTYFPYVLASVKAVEDAAGALPGATKKQIVLTSVVNVAKLGEQIPEPHVQLVSALIDSVVSVLNATGVFGHAAVTATGSTTLPASNIFAGATK